MDCTGQQEQSSPPGTTRESDALAHRLPALAVLLLAPLARHLLALVAARPLQRRRVDAAAAAAPPPPYARRIPRPAGAGHLSVSEQSEGIMSEKSVCTSSEAGGRALRQPR